VYDCPSKHRLVRPPRYDFGKRTEVLKSVQRPGSMTTLTRWNRTVVALRGVAARVGFLDFLQSTFANVARILDSRA